MTKGRGAETIHSQRKRPAPKRVFTMMAEDEFFLELDRLCEAECPPISRAHMLRKLVFERVAPTKQLNGHHLQKATVKAAT
jgi:hypothetical protein